MTKERREHGTIVVLEPGVELLHVLRSDQGKVRIAVYRDRRDGVYHWYDLDFLQPDGSWKEVFRIGDRNLQEAIDMFAAAREFVKKHPPAPEHE